MFCRNRIFHNSLQLHLDSLFREPRPTLVVRVSLTERGPGLPSRLSGKGQHHRPLETLRRDFPSNPLPRSFPPVTFARGARAERALATALATAGLLPPVSPGKRSAAPGGTRAGRAQRSWAERKTRGAVRGPVGCAGVSPTEIPRLGLRASVGTRRLAGARQLREWSSLAGPCRRSCRVSLCERGPGFCAGAYIKILWALWEKGVQIFPKKNFFSVHSTPRKVCPGKVSPLGTLFFIF